MTRKRYTITRKLNGATRKRYDGTRKLNDLTRKLYKSTKSFMTVVENDMNGFAKSMGDNVQYDL